MTLILFTRGRRGGKVERREEDAIFCWRRGTGEKWMDGLMDGGSEAVTGKIFCEKMTLKAGGDSSIVYSVME